jgi:hypothetical protein
MIKSLNALPKRLIPLNPHPNSTALTAGIEKSICPTKDSTFPKKWFARPGSKFLLAIR